MLRRLVAILALANCLTFCCAYGPNNLVEALTGTWKTLTDNENDSLYALNGTTIAWITQRVDNFNIQNEATYNQRYYSNGEHFRAGGPLYVILGRHESASFNIIDNSLIGSLAQSENGHVFLLENRFFGESFPTENLSVDNLLFNTIEQALADAAHFVNHIKTETPGAQNSAVIVLGRNYGGSMAVWFRQKYPHLTAGAWASSSAVLSLQNHQQYKENAGTRIRELAGDECYDAIAAGFRGLEALAGEGKLSEVGGLLKVCDENPLETENDVAAMFLMVSEFFAGIASSRSMVAPVCEDLLNRSGEVPANALASVFDQFFYPRCLPINYENYVRRTLAIENNDRYVRERVIIYQLCTQLGWFQTAGSANQPFSLLYPLGFYTEFCARVFGENVAGHAIAHLNQDRFNVEHGGVNPWISNALFTFGEHDPSRFLYVTRDLHESAVALRIRNVSVAYDFTNISPSDNQVIIEAKSNILKTIRSWIELE